MDEFFELKNKLRSELRPISDGLPEDYTADAGKRIGDSVLKSDLFINAKSVFVYMSMEKEPYTGEIISEALKSGKQVYLPKCYPHHVMKAVRVTDTGALAPGYLGIPEPCDDSETAGPDDLDLIIVPCVAASHDGKRLGHGAGYYDVFLDKADTVTLCLCFEKLICDRIPMSRFDSFMDYIATENGIYRTKNQ